MEGEGMVAVVRGLRDSGLAVTLLDGCRQYTLMPNAAAAASPPSPTHVHISRQTCARAQTEDLEPPRSDSAAQATDGRYASMYKMAHCRVTPTSPPVQLTEFPPQRAELCRGHGNFEVGGCGSGESYTPCRSNGSFRGGMSWPDRGSVCSPRPSREPDAFANSLRKYPNLSVERSTEMVERLITYTQAKNVSKGYQSRYPSPSRHGTESTISNQTSPDRNASRNSVPRSSSYQKNYEPEVNISCKTRPRLEESPTRDLRTNCEFGDHRRDVSRTDSRHLKDVSRKVRENVRNLSAYPYNQPVVSPVIRERYEQSNHLCGKRTPSNLTASNSVNMEVQAAAEMVSKEVATVPRPVAVKRTVAVPLSPTSSRDDQKPEGDVSAQSHAKMNSIPTTYKSVQASMNPSIQTTSSSTDVSNPIHNCRCFAIQRKTKSDENLHRDFKDEIFDLLEQVSVCPNADPRACDLRREVLKQMSIKLQKMSENINWNEGTQNTKFKIGKLLKFVPLWVPSGDLQTYRDAISDEIICRMNRYQACDVYRVQAESCPSNDEKSLSDVLRIWVSNLPLRSKDAIGTPIDKDRMTEKIVDRLKQLIESELENNNIESLKSDILNIVSKLPIALDEYNKAEYLDNKVNYLVKKLKLPNCLYHNEQMLLTKLNPINHMQKLTSRFKYVQPTENEVKECISLELKNFIEKICPETSSVYIQNVETEVIDFIIDSIQAIRSGNDKFVENELIMLLCQEIDDVSWNNARQFGHKLLRLVKNMLYCNTLRQECEQSTSRQSQTYVVLQSTAASCPHKSNANSLHDSSDFSIGAISKADMDANLDVYMNQLTAQIDEWLASLQMQIPEAQDSGFRQVVVHDLAGDIIDRHKYLELNPSCKGSEEDELEHLKYQIFKWINKLAGEENMDTIEHAPELMQRIQSIPVPMLSKPQYNSTAHNCSFPQNSPNVNSSTNRSGGINTKQELPIGANKTKQSLNQSVPTLSCCSSTHLKPASPSMKQLNEEYDEFLKKWVQEIPIPSSTPTEKALADKARMGIYNGVWKAITKLKFEPATFHNLFYYEDALDDELEELLSALPKTSELETRKHLLKVQLIEKTTNTNDLIRSSAGPASFKQQLVESVYNTLPQSVNKKENSQPHEELQILKLVEDYILCANYKETDRVKANIYRKKLIQETQTLVDNIKKTHGKELQNIDADMYINNIFNALHKVPLPNEETLRDEAEEIILATEVEQWFLDIPVAPSSDGTEQLQKKKLKDALVKRIREIEKEVNIFDCTGERVLKHEISSFLENIPMQQGKSLNTTFMAEEFANRMKNKAKQMQANNGTRKSVAFMDSVGYYEFSQHMPYCSSFSDLPGALPAVANQSSYMIRDGAKVDDPYGYNYYAQASLPPHVPLPSEEYFTLEDSQAPPKPNHPQVQPQPQPMEEHNQYSRIQSYKSIPAETIHQTLGQSILPNAQSYHETIREKAVPPVSPERQQNSCCMSGAGNPIPQQTMQGISQSRQSGYAPRLSSARVDQYPPMAPPVSTAPIPPEAQTPCNLRNQSNENRNTSAIQRRAGTPLQTSIANPQGVLIVVQEPQVPSRSPEQMPIPQTASLNVAEQIQQQPIQGIIETTEPRTNCGHTASTYGEPQWFSTPQQVRTEGSPPKPGRKRARTSHRHRQNLERRRLELEDDTEEDFESEGDEPCRCMERMFRSRRPPVCYAYEDFEMDQCYPIPYGSFSTVTNNFTVQLCGNVCMGSKRKENEAAAQKDPNSSHRNIKSVQTSFSSVELVPADKCFCCHRKIKSQEDIRNREAQLQSDVFDWLRETNNGETTTKWADKMQKLAQRLTEPGGEAKIRQKIQKYLKRVPCLISDTDEERRIFREHLPDTIIKKLKKMYMKSERRRTHSSPVRIFRIEIPKEYCINDNSFKEVIKNWLNDIPIKCKDFLGRSIKKEDVIESVVNHLEPHILNRNNFHKDYESTLKATIVEILNEMPIEMDRCDKVFFNDQLASTLLNAIINLNTVENVTVKSNSKAPKSVNLEENIKQFVASVIANILNKLHLNVSTKRLELLEGELKDILIEVMNSKDAVTDDATNDSVFNVLHKLGGLSDYQANYFTHIIKKHFKREYRERHQENTNSESLGPSSNGISYYNNSYPVHNDDTILENNTDTESLVANTKEPTRHDETKSNNDFDSKRITIHIKEWLNELNIQIPLENRDKAVNKLADDITDRLIYLKLNPTSKCSQESELQYFKYQIFNWINKVIGQESKVALDYADKLMERIQSSLSTIYVDVSTKSQDNPTIRSHENNFQFLLLKQAIIYCLNDINKPEDDVPDKDKIVEELSLNIIEQIGNKRDYDDVIEKTVNAWIKNVYKGKQKWIVRDKLKRLLKNKLSFRNNSKQVKIYVRKYEDIIDDWLDDISQSLSDNSDSLSMHEHTHELATQLFETTQKGDNIFGRDHPNNIECIIHKWLKNFTSTPFKHEDIKCLVQMVLNTSNDILIQLNQKDEDITIDKHCNNHQSNAESITKPIKGNVTDENKISTPDIAVYGVILPSSTKTGNITIGNRSIKEIDDDDVQTSLDLYLKQLVEQIDDWLSTLSIPQIHDKGFREIVVNDLAGDIIDRHKYLEHNPSSRGTDESELEQLKYQIFKWINKLVGEDQLETVEHAADLMNRIRGIPVPMLTKVSENTDKNKKSVTNRNIDGGISRASSPANLSSNVRLSNPLGFTTGPMATTKKQNVAQMPLLNSQVRRNSLPAKPNVNSPRRLSAPANLGIPKTPTQQLQPLAEKQDNIPQGLSLEEVYQYFDIIFQERIKQIPLGTSTPEQNYLAELARKGLYNGIWKTYFQLKADPEIESDYSCFEIVFEDRLDKMLDCLPQTNEMNKIRQVWKVIVIADVLSMLKCVHSITDRPSFRQLIAEKFNRQYLKSQNIKLSNALQHPFVMTTAENYILYSKYKEEDPVKANIYKQRLMKRIEELVESIKTQNNVEFRFLNQAQLCQLALQLLESVPIPHNETLTDEVEEILIGEEIEQWYNGLPVKPIRNDTDKVLRKRMRELLAKKLHEIEKNIDLDESAEQNIKQEVSMFIHEKAELQPNEDLKINFMVEELTNRLKNRRQQNLLGYESFEKENPVSSTFVQTDPGEVLAPLIDVGTNSVEPTKNYNAVHQGTLPDQSMHDNILPSNKGPDLVNQSYFRQSIGQIPPGYYQSSGVLGNGRAASPSNQGKFNQSIKQPAPCCQGQGILGTSQVAGPSRQDYYRQSVGQIQPPCCQGQGILGTSQVAGPIQQQSYRESLGRMPPPCCQGPVATNQVVGPTNQDVYQQPLGQIPQPPYQEPGKKLSATPRQHIVPGNTNQSYIEHPSGFASDMRQIPPITIPCAPILPASQFEQINQDNIPVQTSSLPPSADFLTTHDPTPTATRSTARVTSSVPEQEPIDEETDGEEVRYKCRCMERVWKCKKRHIYEGMGRHPRYYPMPFPCRYYY